MKMGLIKYEEKKVRIVDIDDRVFEGKVTDYVYPEDEEDGLESIIIRCTKGPLLGQSIEFWERDIKTIQII